MWKNKRVNVSIFDEIELEFADHKRVSAPFYRFS